MLLAQFIEELWLHALILAFLWLVLPLILVSFSKYRIAIAIEIWWAVMFVVMAYVAFGHSTRSYHPNTSTPLISTFGFLLALMGFGTSVSMATLIAIIGRRSRGMPVMTNVIESESQ
jgi:hypothetical protein